MASGLTASINQTFNFSRIVVVAVTFIVATAWIVFLKWIADKLPAKDWARFLHYLITMVGIMGAFYLILSAMVSAAKMAAINAGGKKMGCISGFVTMATSILKVIIATVVPVLLLVAAAGVLWAMGLLGAIPKFGPIFWGIFSFIPVLVGLFAAFVLAKLFLVIFLIPGIMATSDEGGYKCYKAAAHIIKTRLVKLLAWFVVAFFLVSLFFTIVGIGQGILIKHTRVTMATKNTEVIGAGSMPGITKTNAIGLAGYSLVPRLAPGPTLAQDKTVITGGWFFGIEYAVVLAVLCACGYIFFALSGMQAYAALSAEPEDPISLTMPVDLADISQRAAKFKEAVSEKVKAEMSEGEEEKKTGTKK